MLWFFLVVFVVAPLVELFVIIQVAGVIGGWWTVALLLADSLVGAWLVKRQGVSVLRRIQDDLRQRKLPAASLVDGLLILFAGALMLTPGFVTDALGFVLLVPLTRAPIRKLLLAYFTKKLGTGAAWLGVFDGGISFGGGSRSAGYGAVYDTQGYESGQPTRTPPGADPHGPVELPPGDGPQ